MIPFFRQLRQRILAENKLSKYLVYAVGETLLVVIGILIALQVNNWNEEQRQKAEERTLLSGLLEDLQMAGRQSAAFIDKENQLVEDLVLTLDIHPEGKQAPDSLFTDAKIGNLLWNFESNVPVINSYAEIKNTGKTALIRNRNIRERFTNLEISLNKLTTLVKDRLTVQQLRIDAIAENKMNFVRYMNRDPSILHVDLSREPENDYRVLFEDRGIRNLLAIKLVLTQDVLTFRKDLQADIDKIIELIQNELAKQP